MPDTSSRQIENRNYLSPTGFRFLLKKSPKIAYFCNQANLPSLDMGTAIQPTYFKDLDTPGDKVEFGDLTLRFLVDEDLKNYMELQKWIRGLGYPESGKDITDLQSLSPGDIGGAYYAESLNIYSDGTLQILSNNLVPKFQVFFKDLFPTSLSTITFDATDTDIEYFTAEANFKYSIYTINDMSGNPL
jgi:hypothetical protein|tara:strand:- start:169 stop:732 length:564 start_codon:yes stop_codon:yes gene_type:complete